MSEAKIATVAHSELSALYEAMNRVQAIIEFDLDGTILNANANFLQVFEYTLEEVVGKHHRMFCESDYANTPAYDEFWKKLASGEYTTAEFKRLGKGGKEIWLSASYNPVFENGKPVKVVKFATDVTASKLQAAEKEGMVKAIDRVQAVIEFDLDGTVLNANQNFLQIFGYELDEVVGKHHRVFCEPGYAESADYAEFWNKLGRGGYEAGEFKRLHKNGTEIWLQASYNPILDADGDPRKVVKFASDITHEVKARSLALLEMSTPVTAIWRDILMLPIVGIIDSNRAHNIMNAMLTAIADTQSRVIIMDISGVAMVDTAVANHLIKITKATKLMGCDCTISGVSASIAQTMVELGIVVGDVRTTATLKDALVDAFRATGAEIRNIDDRR
ncbi:MAG: PAS domain S-box protein [Phycisphaerae bacterium]